MTEYVYARLTGRPKKFLGKWHPGKPAIAFKPGVVYMVEKGLFNDMKANLQLATEEELIAQGVKAPAPEPAPVPVEVTPASDATDKKKTKKNAE